MPKQPLQKVHSMAISSKFHQRAYRLVLCWIVFCAASFFTTSPRGLFAENILFYGNSFTNGSGSTDSVPNLVRDIATSAGQGDAHRV